MLFKTFTLAAGVTLAFAGSAAAATYAFTEGNGQNRALVAGSVDLEDASSGGGGFDLGSFGSGDVLGIYGRIVGSVDRFSFTFDITNTFDVRFDLDGYDLGAGGNVGAGFSGLVNQNYVTSGGTKGAAGGKGVVISLLDSLSSVVGTQSFTTNMTSDNVLDPVIFGNIGPGTYTLVVDGSSGPDRRTPALYDIEIAADVPLPAAGFLLLGGLGGLAALRRKRAA